MIELTAEIHFHEQEKASVFLESNCSGDPEKFGEIALFVFCALRMLSNLDVCEPSDALARIIMVPSMVPGVSAAEMTENLQLIPYPGYAGRKRFSCKLSLSNQGCKFDLDLSGFDLEGGTDLGYYAPSAVIALMKYFAQRRADDLQFQTELVNAAQACGTLHLKRQISLSNQHSLGIGVLDGSRKRYAPSLLESFFLQTGQSRPTSASVQRDSAMTPKDFAEFVKSAWTLVPDSEFAGVLMVDIERLRDFEQWQINGHLRELLSVCSTPVARQNVVCDYHVQKQLVSAFSDGTAKTHFPNPRAAEVQCVIHANNTFHLMKAMALWYGIMDKDMSLTALANLSAAELQRIIATAERQIAECYAKGVPPTSTGAPSPQASQSGCLLFVAAGLTLAMALGLWLT